MLFAKDYQLTNATSYNIRKFCPILPLPGYSLPYLTPNALLIANAYSMTTRLLVRIPAKKQQNWPSGCQEPTITVQESNKKNNNDNNKMNKPL